MNNEWTKWQIMASKIRKFGVFVVKKSLEFA